MKSEYFQSVYLSDAYRSFGSANEVSSTERLAEAHQRAQAFVDRCEQVEKNNDQDEKEKLKQMQSDEMKRVFQFTCQ